MLQILMGDYQKLSFSTLTKVPFLIRQTSSMLKLCPASLLNKTEQTSQVELEHRGGLSDQKIKKSTFVRVEKLSF